MRQPVDFKNSRRRQGGNRKDGALVVPTRSGNLGIR